MQIFLTVKNLYIVVLTALSVILVTLPVVDFFKNILYWNNEDIDNYVNFSSVWCSFYKNSHKHCKFKNVCYHHVLKTILFSLTSDSVISGLSSYSDLQRIQLSTIKFHNKFYANISVVNGYTFRSEKSKKVIPKGIVIGRFKPDNIMHVVHDDLLPLYLTFEQMCLGNVKKCVDEYQLIIHDFHKKGPYFNMYKLFSKNTPVFLNQQNELLCVEELVMGISPESVFYQYGFNNTVHGPVKNYRLTVNDLKRFTSYIQEKLMMIDNSTDDVYGIAFISRERSRRIINKNDIVHMLHNLKINKKDIKLTMLDLSKNETSYFIKIIHESKLLIGMHGAEMIFSMFMKAKSAILEMFPFAIQSDIVSFVKPMTEIKGSNYAYISWTNTYRNNSVTHPTAHPLYGGIDHLSEQEQLRITQLEKIPAVMCCNDPAYLHYMFQDTYVQPWSFANTLNKAISQKPNTHNDIFYDWFWPSEIMSFNCNFNWLERKLYAKWLPPFNVKQESVAYSVFILSQDLNFQREMTTLETRIVVHVPLNSTQIKFRLWISTVLLENNARSNDFYTEC